MNKKISLEPYKGVRDFYPEDQFVQNYIFSVWKKVCQNFGYQEYSASILEPLELYKSKTSEEIVNTQTYSFKDQGEREVVLRPEMTPTAARMIANRLQDFPPPVRWYSVTNFFRYERPQRGRYREFFQLNADIFGVSDIMADIELILISSSIMRAFGASDDNFEIKINSRKLLEDIYKSFGIENDKRQIISRIIDKKDKISESVFEEALKEEMENSSLELISLLQEKEGIFEKYSQCQSLKELRKVIENLWQMGVKNVVFSPTLTRGFDYYTGIVFEVYDTNSENPRAILGGGRYDELVKVLSGKNVPATGFAIGDATMRDYLETYKLMPNLPAQIDLWLAVAPKTSIIEINKIAAKLREKNLRVAVDTSGKKLSDQLKSLEKRKVSSVMVLGSEELQSGKLKIRNVATREEKEGNLEEIIQIISA